MRSPPYPRWGISDVLASGLIIPVLTVPVDPQYFLDVI